MNSLILCEGKTDCILLQYYLEKVYLWNYKDKNGLRVERDCWSNCFTKSEYTLNITETKGCSRLVEGLIKAIKRNENVAPGSTNEFFDKIIIFRIWYFNNWFCIQRIMTNGRNIIHIMIF